MAPHIAAFVHVEPVTQSAGAVFVITMAATENITEADAEVFIRKTITSAAAGQGAGGKPGASENKEDCKSS
jgi:hypothetical protein